MTGKSRQSESRSQLSALGTQSKAPSGMQSKAPAERGKPSRPQEVRTRPVRMSLDWMPADHRRIRSVCDEVAEITGRASVPATDLIRAAVLMVLDSSDLRKRLDREVSSGRGRL